MRMTPTAVKFCGITRAEDIEIACALGVGALGFIFAPRSARALTPARATELVDVVTPGVTRIGLFVDPDVDEVRAVLDCVPLDALQFHGEESANFCRQFGLPYLKALAMGRGQGGESGADRSLGRDLGDASAVIKAHPEASAFVFDAHHPGTSGGTGVTFDWSRLDPSAPRPTMILAGGLDPDNVFDAIVKVRPAAVDVASGIECAPGRKHAGRMRHFMSEVGRANDLLTPDLIEPDRNHQPRRSPRGRSDAG